MHEMNIQCPYCLQAISVLLDLGVYNYTTIIDDCEVCCRPIELSYNVQEGEVTTFSYSSMEGNEY